MHTCRENCVCVCVCMSVYVRTYIHTHTHTHTQQQQQQQGKRKGNDTEVEDDMLGIIKTFRRFRPYPEAEDDIGLQDQLLPQPEVVFTSLECRPEDATDLLEVLKTACAAQEPRAVAEEPMQLGFLSKIIKDNKNGIAMEAPLALSQDLASQPLEALTLPQDTPCCLRAEDRTQEGKAGGQEELEGGGAGGPAESNSGGTSSASSKSEPSGGAGCGEQELRDSRRKGKEPADDVGDQGAGGIVCADPAQELNLDDELEAFMQTRGRMNKKARGWQAGAARVRQDGVGGELDASAGAAMALVGGHGGVDTVKVKIDSDTPLALTAFILRCIGCAVMSELVEQGNKLLCCAGSYTPRPAALSCATGCRLRRQGTSA